ncbi:MAG TPA: hypothetical protein PL155_06885 [Candidatus Omnitrophota bacterium]|nr:hypothetical protein [Candidatus Omnitrophota bacterium]HPD85566.1 hypothetical protein [Candidatus Omnitrophota bacterium]HRZ04394.1 hypothetical protein [Candidatus Omnitrophota bacterium]
MSVFDMAVLINALASFLFFAVVQFFSCRFVSSKEVLRWLMNLVILGLAVNIAGGIILFLKNPEVSAQMVFGAKGLCLILSAGVYLLVTFHYIVLVFGPYESSVRLRVLRELYKEFPRGMLPRELLSRYNARTVVDRRLDRLVSSGEIELKDGVYRVKNRKNYFTVSDIIVGKLRKIAEGK